MKNFTLLTILFSLVLSSGLFAQTLNSNVLPEAGDIFQSMNADTNGIVPGTNGSGLVWDFSNLSPTGNPVANVFMDPASTPFAAEFPSANLASETAIQGFGSTYSYYKREGSDLNLLGSMSGDVKSDETLNPELWLSTPMGFGSTVSDDFQGITTSPNATFYNHGEKTMTYNASGTLIMPGAEFSSAMRILTIATRTDSTEFSGVISKTTTTAESYSWYASGVIGPIVTVSFTGGESVTISPGFPPVVTEIPAVKSVNFNPDATPGVNATAKLDLSFKIDRLFPTPAEHEVYLSIESEKTLDVRARLFNLVGRQIALEEWKIPAGKQTKTIDLSDLPSGMYLLNLEEGKAHGTYRVIKK